MNFVRSTLKIVLGLFVFASLMVLEFTSYTRAVAEGVKDERLLNSHKSPTDSQAAPDKKVSKLQK